MNRYEAALIALGDKAMPENFYASRGESTTASSVNLYRSSCGGLFDTEENEISTPSPADETALSSPCSEDQEIGAGDDAFDNLLGTYVAKFKENCKKFQNDPNIVQGLKIAVTRMEKASINASSFGSYLCSTNNAVPIRYRAGSQIRVQPTAPGRRTSIGRGSKRVRSGRPAKNNLPTAPKRPHMLLTNINNNMPNAKSHGGTM